MQRWNNSWKIGGGLAAVAVLAGVGVLVWALGFRGDDKQAQPAAKGSGLSQPATQPGDDLRFNISSPNVAATEGGISLLNTGPMTSFDEVAGDVLFSQANTKAGQSFDYAIAGDPNVVDSGTGGISQLKTAPMAALDSIASPGEILFGQATLGAGSSLRYTPSDTQAFTPGGGGIGQLGTAPLHSLDEIASPGEAVFSDPSAGFGQDLRYTPSDTNAVDGGAGGFQQLKTSPLTSFNSLGSPGDALFSEASLGASEELRYTPATANVADGGTGGIQQLKTSPLTPFSSLASPGEVLFADANFTPQELTVPSGATPNAPTGSFKIGAGSPNSRSLSSTSSSAAATVGVLFCGGVVSGRCQPQYRGRMPHTAKQLLVGFVWQTVATGTRIQLVFFDVARKKIIGRPTPAFALPTATGGKILAGFKGPFPVLQLGVGALVNGKALKGAWVLNIT